MTSKAVKCKVSENHFEVLENGRGFFRFLGNCPPTPPLSQH